MSLKIVLDCFDGNYSTLFTTQGGTLAYDPAKRKWMIKQGSITAKNCRQTFEVLVQQLSEEPSFEGIKNLAGFIRRVNEVWFSKSKYSFKSNTQEIHFNSRTSEYQFLSNFAPTLVLVDGKVYPSSEHAYQSLRTTLIGGEEGEMESSSSAISCKKQGRKAITKWNESATEEELEAYRRRIVPLMERIVSCKFDSNPVMSEALKRTYPSYLIEQTDSDFWGAGRDGQGQNYLGRILIAKREQLMSDDH